MRGMIFRSFQDFVEQRFGEAVMDEALQLEALATSGGAYTSVGNYPTSEFVTLAVEVSERTDTALPDLIKAFGEALFTDLAGAHRDMVASFASCFDLLAGIEVVIHRNVRKLYDTDEVPHFEVLAHDGDAHLKLRYSSARPFADLAEGLIKGALRYYDLYDKVRIVRHDLSEDGTQAEFDLTRHDRGDP